MSNEIEDSLEIRLTFMDSVDFKNSTQFNRVFTKVRNIDVNILQKQFDKFCRELFALIDERK